MTDVNEKSDHIGKAMQAAWRRVKNAQSRMWGEWMTIGEGLLEGRRWAMRIAGVNRPEGRGYVTAFAEWLKRYRVDDMDKSDRAKLLQLMEERAAVEEWRATLTDNERRNLNNPVMVWRKWTAATRVKKPKPRSAGVSASEMGRARDLVQQQDERILELEEELASAREHGIATSPLDALKLLLRTREAGGFAALAQAAIGEVDYVDLIDLNKEIATLIAALKRAAKTAPQAAAGDADEPEA